MRIIVAPDSFKGSLTALEAAQAIADGIHDTDPKLETILFPVADGGEGTVESLVTATGGKEIPIIVQDPLGRNVETSYGVLGDGETCVIEIAKASGLLLLSKTERNPLLTSTYGTGQLIRAALDSGYRKFIIGLGGSATNDAGTGMLSALGMKFLDEKGKKLAPGGGAQINLARIDAAQFDKRIAESSFIIAADVDNPFIGENGATFVFGPQKGATPEMVEYLERSIINVANVIEKQTGISLHHMKGAGAAGGLGGAFLAFFPAEMNRGIEVVLQAISFDQHIKKADLIITGEGKTDSQTLSGKTPLGIAKEAQKNKKPVILISGSIEGANDESFHGIFTEMHAIADGTISKKESIKNAYRLLRKKTKEVLGGYIKGKANM